MSKTIYSDQIKVNCPLVCDESGYFHLVYKITNLVNGKIYIGKHSTKNPYDNYMGSGKRIELAIKKYEIKNFIKEILFCFDKEDDAFLKEAEIVNQEFIDRNDTYNVILGGKGLQKSSFPNEKTRNKISKALKGKMAGEKNPMYGKTHNKETRKRLSEMHLGERNHNFGKHLSQETKSKISKALKGKRKNFNKRPRNPLSQEHKDKISKALKGRVLTEEHKRKLSKGIIKIDESENIIVEYEYMKDCCTQENISRYILLKLIKEHILYNGFYFEFKSKT